MTTADLFQSLIEATSAITATLGLIAVLRKPLRRHLGARAGYALWLAVPLALLATGLPGPATSSALAADSLPRNGLAMVAHWLPQANHNPSSAWLLVWAGGALAMLLWLTHRQMQFQRHLGALREHADGSFRSVTLAAPALIGLWQPRIVLPGDFEQRYNPAEQALVLAHERAHRRHGDPWANTAAAGLLCLFWFNPLLYWALGRFRFDQELACDARVLESAPRARQPYAHALLKTQLSAEAAWPLPVGCHWQSSHPLTERITMLSQYQTSTTRRRSGVALALVLCLTGSYAVWAAQPATPDFTNMDSKAADTTPVLRVLQSEDVVNPPKYPASALANKVSGDVGLKVYINADGSIGDVVVLSSEPAGVFDQMAIDAAKQWKFNPKRKDGMAVPGWVKIPVKFRADGKPDDAAAPTEN